MFSSKPTKLIVFLGEKVSIFGLFPSYWSQIATSFDSQKLAKNWEERILKNSSKKVSSTSLEYHYEIEIVGGKSYEAL